MEHYLFPFGSVPSGSSIVIYGAGMVGQYFLQEIRQTGYCKVLAVADRTWHGHEVFDVPIIKPKDIVDLPYDRVVIALRDEGLLPEISNYLMNELGVPAECVVAELSWTDLHHHTPFKVDYSQSGQDLAYRQEGLSIAFLVDGGLGDIIVAKKYISTILDLAEDGFCVDIYGNKLFISAIFGQPEWLNNIYPTGMYWREYNQYDISVHMSYLIQINNMSELRVKSHSSRLYNVMLHMKKQIENYGLAYKSMMACYVHFARCRYLGLNAYTCYNEPGGIEITSMSVEIPLQDRFLYALKELKLPPYITLHYGWGELPKGTMHHVKVWPIQHYERFIKKIKEKWPEISILQVGSENDQRLPGVDRRFMGEDLELVKWLLKGSIMHIDDEGGLVHLATQLGTKCAVLFGPTPVWYFGYPQNINIVASACSSCYYLNGNFATCIRQQSQPECMYSITPELVFNRIKEYIVQSLMMHY